jgi:hypothetical protein
VLKKTEVPNEINFDEFYEIITAPRRYWNHLSFKISSFPSLKSNT